jgi:hypothetical protein
MTFLEAALKVLSRERCALHYKDLTDKVILRKLLTFVGRTPVVTMQTQLTNAVKKAPGNPFVRVAPGVFGLLRYPEPSLEPEAEPEVQTASATAVADAEPAEQEQKARERPERSRERGGRHRGGRRGNGRYGQRDVLGGGGPPGGNMSDELRTDGGQEREGLEEAPALRSLSAQERAAALAEAGVLGDDDTDTAADAGEAEPRAASGDGEVGAQGAGTPDDDRGRGATEAGGAEGATAASDAQPASRGSEAGSNGRRIMTPIDAAIEVLGGQGPGRGMSVRNIADAAVRRRLVHGEASEAWRVMRTALAAEPRERMRQGLRPRVRSTGTGAFALTRRPIDMDLDKAEHVFGEARRAVRERTLAALEKRLSELAPPAFEAIARVLLQREDFGPATFVKKVEGTVYLEALRGRGSRPSRCLIGVQAGGGGLASRRSIGELRAGIRARGQDEGLLMVAARLGDEAVAEWRQSGPPIEIIDGPGLAESCVRHGVGVINAVVSVDFVDGDFFAELTDG